MRTIKRSLLYTTLLLATFVCKSVAQNSVPETEEGLQAGEAAIGGLVHQGSGLLKEGILMAISGSENNTRIVKVNNGNFLSDSLNIGYYTVMAVPAPWTTGSYLPTYYVTTVNEPEAAVINLRGKISGLDIYLVPFTNGEMGTSKLEGWFGYFDIFKSDDGTAYDKDWFEVSNTPSGTITKDPVNPCKTLPIILYRFNQPYGGAVTDSNGYFKFNNLPSGTYTVKGLRPGNTNYHGNDFSITAANQTVGKAFYFVSGAVTGLSQENEAITGMGSPNPFTDQLTLGYDCTVENAQGVTFYTSTAQSAATVDTRHWPAGLYFLKSKHSVVRIVKY